MKKSGMAVPELEGVLRRRHDELRGRPLYLRERAAAWLARKWQYAPSASEVLLVAAACALLLSTAIQSLALWTRLFAYLPPNQ